MRRPHQPLILRERRRKVGPDAMFRPGRVCPLLVAGASRSVLRGRVAESKRAGRKYRIGPPPRTPQDPPTTRNGRSCTICAWEGASTASEARVLAAQITSREGCVHVDSFCGRDY